MLHSLERNDLIEGVWEERKRLYKLASKGEKTINTLLDASDIIKGFIANILKA